MSEIPVLETERLRLRAPSEVDFDAEVTFFASDRSKGVGGPLPRELVWRKLASTLGHWMIRGYGQWAVEEKSSGAYCDRVGLYYPEGWPEPEVSWTLMDHAEGRGIAYEAATHARAYAFDTLGWTTTVSLMDEDNTRSHLLAKRLGAVWESSYTHPQYGTMHTYRHPSPEDLK
jgi:RimJ/RimL family protein N-acetyltransferase